MATLHIHADESGNFTFGPKGTKHYTFAVAWTENPQPLATALTCLRFGYCRTGDNIQRFHASDDMRATRRQVIDTLIAHDNWRFCAAVVVKSKLYKPLQEPRRFYPQFLSMPLRFVLRGRVGMGTDRC